MMQTRVLLIVCLWVALMPAAVFSQSHPQWEGYPSLNEMSGLTVLDGTVWGATSQGLFGYDIARGEYRYYYRNHGFDATGLTAIDATGRYVYIGTRADGLFRFDPDTGSFEPILFPEYVNTTDATASLAINDIAAISDTILYVALDKGIDRLNLATEELRTYSQLSTRFDRGIAVNDIEVFDGKLWAGTGQGLAWADPNNPSLESADAWESFIFGRSYRPAAVNSLLKHVRGPGDSLLYIATGSQGVIEFSPDTGDTVSTTLRDTNIRSLAHGFGTIVAGSLYEGYFVKTGDEWVQQDSLTVFMRLETAADGNIWAASGEDGLQLITVDGLASLNPMNLPAAPTIRDIEIASDGTVWMSTAYRDEGGYVQRFRDGGWTSFIQQKPLYFQRTNGITVDGDNRLWASCWGTDMYVADTGDPDAPFEDTVTLIDEDYEFFVPYIQSPPFMVAPDIDIDSGGNKWVAGFAGGVYVFDGGLPVTEHPHRRFTFDDASAAPLIMTVHADSDGWVWLGTWETGLIGLNTGSDPYDGVGDSHVYITGGGGSNELLGTRVYSAAPDLDHDVWVGTNNGLNRVVKHSGTTLEVIDESGLLDGNTLEVFAIAVDVTGSKWIGTSNGLYRIGPDNTQTAVYTTSNSGLISDRILSLAYDPNGKRLLAGTDAGLNVFYPFGDEGDGEGTLAYVYPNPFEVWGSDSRATFEGLGDTAPLRIFTFNGELVIELDPQDMGGLGAQAVWDGANYRGEYVGSGVYFYTGKDSRGRPFRSKLAVIRR